MEQRRLLSPQDVEQKFAISPRQQQRLRKSGRLAYLKLGPSRGSRILYDVADVEAFLAAHRHEAKG